MFDSIRKHQRILQLVLLVLIFPAFAFFGIQGYDRFFSDEGVVAKVAGERITRPEFEDAQRRQFENLRQMLGDQADPRMLDNEGARKEILDGLVVQRALLVEANRKRVWASDEQLRQTILGIAGLTKPDGSFDFERYRSLLAAQGKNEAMFEAEVRRDLALQALPESLAQTAFVPRTVLERVVALGEQTREVRELVFRASDYAGKVSPTDEQLKKYYDANQAGFTVPESAKVEYLVLDAASIAKAVVLNPDEVRSFYEQNKARWSTREQRRASHILVRVPESAPKADRDAALRKAEELLAQLRGGADFAALAKSSSQDPGSAAKGGDLGFFSADMMVKPFADAAFALKEGETSGVVESEFGFHLIRVTGIRPGAVRPFDEVKADIEAEIRNQQASRQFAEAAENFSNLVYEQSDSLEPAAKRFGLAVQAADQIGRSGNRSLPREHPLNNQRLLEALFSRDSIAAKRNTEAVDLGGNRLAAARIVEHSPSQVRPFDAVRDTVKALVVQQEARRLAREAGEAKLAALRGGAAPEGFSEPKTLTRSGGPNVPPAAVEAVFRAPSAKLPSFAGAEIGDEGYGVWQVVKVNTPAEGVLAARTPQYRQQFEQSLAQQELGDYIESLKARSKVEIFPAQIGSRNRAE